MTDADESNAESLIGAVLRGLDLAVVEWDLDQSYRPLSSTPRWFTGSVPWSSLPFLQLFVDEARRFLHDHVGGIIASDQFTAQSNSEELLLRARALKAGGRLIIVIERLEGAADMRPVLRHARQQALEYEQLTERARAVHAPLDRAAQAIADLQQGTVLEAQRPAIDALSRALASLQEMATALPPPRRRR